jgi:Peptidase family M23
MMGLFLIQLVLPLALVTWLWAWPQPSSLGAFLQIGSAGALTQASYLSGLWTSFPRWGLAVVMLIGLAALIRFAQRQILKTLPYSRPDWLLAALNVILLGVGIWVIAEARLGQRKPNEPSIALELPLEGNDLVVANGGSRLLINAHQDTLDLSIPRHRLWHGQSYAIDIVALNRLQMTANGMRPADPARYVIFGRAVHAPCGGQIVGMENNRPDLVIPKVDARVKEGNYVRLRCSGADIVMAHLQRGSVRVSINQWVTAGDNIAAVGNSGMTDEPHLHIHAQTLGSPQAPFSGEPIIMLFNGRFLARNDRI